MPKSNPTGDKKKPSRHSSRSSKPSSNPVSPTTPDTIRSNIVASSTLLTNKGKSSASRAQPDGLVGLPPSRDRDHGTVVRTTSDDMRRQKEVGEDPKDGEPATKGAAAQLSKYREQLARNLDRQGTSSRPAEEQTFKTMAKVSPIKEEGTSPTPFSPGPSSTSTNASLESVATIRGLATPGAVKTPSYPFPRVRPASSTPTTKHNEATAYTGTQTVRGQGSTSSSQSSPGSAAAFQPGVSRQTTFQAADDLEFPTPNLYDMALMLNAEPGLEAWWSTVVQIMTAKYKAERIALAVPADLTDLENVPWGQKATYNAALEDDLSLQYLRRGGTLFRSSTSGFSEFSASVEDTNKGRTFERPDFNTRHSYTEFEDEKRKQSGGVSGLASLRRPNMSARSKSSVPGAPSPGSGLAKESTLPLRLNKEALREHDAEEEARSSEEDQPTERTKNSFGRVLPVLQALEYEGDFLIDNEGVQRVLDRGRVIALTRGYPYLEDESSRASTTTSTSEDTKRKSKKVRLEASNNLSSILSTANLSRAARRDAGGLESDRRHISNLDQLLEEEGPRRAPTPNYEEVEQLPPSPWSQSPAPSPAVRFETSENPFFNDSMIDEESFNPAASPQDYSNVGPQEAIGVDNSWTILHVPLKHVLMPKKPQGFRLDASILEQRSSKEGTGKGKGFRTRQPSPVAPEHPAPIAILSIQSAIIPYPANLRRSLDHLAPHLATSYSLARHYSNLEAEVLGAHQRRVQTTGFGAIDGEGRPLQPINAARDFDEMTDPAPSMSGLTSPSNMSVRSRSGVASLSGTPLWEGSLKTPGQSPATREIDNYFSSGAKTEARKELLRRDSSRTKLQLPNEQAVLGRQFSSGTVSRAASATENQLPTTARPQTPRDDVSPKQAGRTSPSEATTTTSRSSSDEMSSSPSNPATTPRAAKIHAKGADFAVNYQSLPPGSAISSTSRRGTREVEMAVPSRRLQDTILDLLPAQVFLASPQNGSIIWVNSRYLSYRGQTTDQLAADPWGSIHPEDRGSYLAEWAKSVRTGDAFARKVRIRRFDGAYRMFFARAAATRDKSNTAQHIIGSYMDIHDQHILELKANVREEIEASEAKHRLLANLIPQIIFTATEDEGITFANDQWLLYTGQEFSNTMGLGFLDFVHPDDLAKCRIGRLGGVLASKTNAADESTTTQFNNIPTTNLTELVRQGVVKIAEDSGGRPSYSAEIRLRAKDGSYRWHLVRCVEFDNVTLGSQESSYFGSATDINDLKLLESQLKVAMDSKSRFLSNMSHEIRTPLIGISGMVSFLQDTTLNEEQRDFTNTIQTSANSLLTVINDILDLSKVDAGMMKLSYEWFHTRTLVEDVNELVSTLAIAKGLELNYLIDEDVPTYIKGDRVRLRQILLNVIGNAIKFTHKGEVFSRCKVIGPASQDVNAKDIMLEFSVIDTGRGFSKEEATLMFKPFSQIDGSSTRQHGGSGLGLVISRQLVELHGGKMSGSAVPEKGATFTFTAKFGLPTDGDRPDVPVAPLAFPAAPLIPDPSQGIKTKSAAITRIMEGTPSASPGSIDYGSPPPLDSNGSSLQSVSSVGTAGTRGTNRSSMSSIGGNLARFHEAARASSEDSFRTRLDLPTSRSPSTKTPTQDAPLPSREASDYRPLMFSVLVISPQQHSREATVKHIEMTLPKGAPAQVTALARVDEAKHLIGSEDSVFSHIVLNLVSIPEAISLMDVISKSRMGSTDTKIVILSDTVKRQSLTRTVAGTEHESQFAADERVTWIYKPVKLSRFAAIFDPTNVGELGIDQSRSTAQKIAETHKQSYLDLGKKVGQKGYKVLLVEDNPVNQKVLKKYLLKVGLDFELASDGVECTDKIFAHEHGYYALILCDLHMPRKDGYQACREIRAWEAEHEYSATPIIALSANVMSDVQAKCVEAGFSDYVTKPVDFVDLSAVLSKFFKD